jgi:predicted N-acetyltransferase YhbS
MPLAERPYRDAADFAAMQALISRSWLERRPLVSHTVGDIEWWTINDPDETPEDLVTLWFDGPELVGWVWLEPPDAADWMAMPDATAEVLGRTLDSIEAAAPSTDGTRTTRIYARDDDEVARGIVAERGYVPDGRAFHHWLRKLPAGGGPAIPQVTLPAGYRSAATRWPDDLEARVEVHRSAFAPSRMTVEKYRAMHDRAHYAPERDRVIVAPDGTFAAFANAWWDPVARVGELEPVGVHADHRRLGLGRAVCFDAFRALEALGAEECLIFSSVTNEGSEALYASLGCEAVTTNRRYARTVSG